jgi:hypothetical protein
MACDNLCLIQLTRVPVAACSVHNPKAEAASDEDGMAQLANCTHAGIKLKVSSSSRVALLEL